MSGRDVHLLSAGTVLPGPAIDNAALARRFGMTPVWAQWVDTFVGTRARHFAVDLDTGERRHCLADLGATAAERAMAAAGLAASDIDVLVMATATPDNLMPTTVNLVADRLGIDQVPTYQLQSGCTGAVQALDVARQMLVAGTHRTALVVGGDVCAKFLDIGMNLAELPPEQLVNVVQFGDGAGAAVLGVDPVPSCALLHRTLVRFTGLHRPPGQVVEWFGPADRPGELPAGSEDYKAIEQLVPAMAEEVLHELLEDLDWKDFDVDYLLPPQLSGRMTQRIVERLDVPSAQEVSCVADTGNTANALPFFQFEAALERMVAGDRALGVSIESSKWIKAGFAFERV